MDASHQTELINSRNNLEGCRQQCVSSICPPLLTISFWCAALCTTLSIYFAFEQQLLHNLLFSSAEIRLEVPSHQTIQLKIGEA